MMGKREALKGGRHTIGKKAERGIDRTRICKWATDRERGKINNGSITDISGRRRRGSSSRRKKGGTLFLLLFVKEEVKRLGGKGQKTWRPGWRIGVGWAKHGEDTDEERYRGTRENR